MVKWVKKKKKHLNCVKCGIKIPSHKRSDAKYCSKRCREAAEKARYCKRNPDYVKRQRRLVAELKHMKEHGHTDFIDNPIGNPKDKYARARALGFRSMLEVKAARQLEALGVEYEYEKTKIPYKVDETKTYVPDIQLPNGIFIETKGRFLTADRKKHLLIKEQHPDLDIRFVFSNPNAKIRKGSKTSYADWCDKHGFLYAKEVIPIEWVKEKKKC